MKIICLLICLFAFAEEGLQLYIARDGSTALGSQQLKNR